MMSALPPRSGESPRRGVSRLEMMQAKFQAKQLEEKEEKMIQILEDKQERTIQRVNYGRDSANSTNSFSSSASSNSVTGGLGPRPGGGGRVRQMFDQRRAGASPVGWAGLDKSYPLDPVEAVNSEVVRTPLYKQNVTRNNSYNKYSGNYGPKAGAGGGSSNSYGKRGMSLDRSKGRQREGQSQAGYSSTMTRAHSQATIGHSSSEDSFTGSARPYSGLGYHGTPNLRARKPSGGTKSYNYGGAALSPENSPPQQRKAYQTPGRDYSRPLPPTYRRQNSRSRLGDPSPSRHSYHDSAYSSHSSQSSDNPPASAFSVIQHHQSPPPLARPPLSTQSSPSKSYSRQNSFSYEQNPRINSRTFRKQKSPVRHRSPSISPTRSAENSDETDLALNDDYGQRGVSRNAERAREEERRRMQVEMRKREQELLSKIKEQQRELDAVKAEKTKVERELTRAEREREEERRQLLEKEKTLELERQRMEVETRRSQEVEVDRRDSYRRPYDRVLNREKASPAHLRGRRPPSLVSSDNDEEVEKLCMEPPAPAAPAAPAATAPPTVSTVSSSTRVPFIITQSEPRAEKPPTLERRPSVRKAGQARVRRENKTESPGVQRREGEVKARDNARPLRIQRTPSLRRKAEVESNKKEKGEAASKSVGLSRLRGNSRGPSREPSFEDERESSRSSVKSRSTTYISGGSVKSSSGNNTPSSTPNTVKIEIKDAKKSVPPSPAIKKKAPPAGSTTPARRSLFAPKPRDDLKACKNCGRNFADDRIEKHEEICLKTTAKKRKVFDMTKARVKGTDAAKYVRSSAHLKNIEAKEQKKSDWRKKREEFINNLRAAKEVQRHLANGGSIKDLPPPPPSDTSDYIQCPHCGRRFSEGAADRHIPKCKDIKSNKKR